MSSVQVSTQPRMGTKPKMVVPSKRVISKELKKGEPKKGDPLLPPCQICGGKSSGYHFGVISCESCKIFFRRSLTKETPYQCKKDNNCELGTGKWSSCSACRLNKCLELGMSIEGVKKGRHSLERKSTCVTMVKQIEEEEKKKQEVKEQADMQRKQEMADLAAGLYEVHMKHLLVTAEKLAMIRENEAQRKDMDGTIGEITGPVEPLPLEYIREFYELTGLDLGGLKARLQLCLTQCHEVLIKKCIEYSKDVPNFMDLPLTDRILLVKATMLDWYLMSKFQVVNWKDKMYSCVICGAIYTDEEYKSVTPAIDFSEGLRPSHTLQQLDLHQEEVAVLRAFVFFDTSRSCEELLEREKIDSLQNEYLECLLYILEKHRGATAAPLMFAKLTHVLTQSRSTTKWKIDLVVQILKTYRDIQFSQLVMEIFNISYMENIKL